MEATWVVSDFSSSSKGELSVSKGQQVEMLGAEAAGTAPRGPEWCFVRVCDDAASPREGYVPLAVLKPHHTSPSRKPPQEHAAGECPYVFYAVLKLVHCSWDCRVFVFGISFEVFSYLRWFMRRRLSNAFPLLAFTQCTRHIFVISFVSFCYLWNFVRNVNQLISIFFAWISNVEFVSKCRVLL